jgi:UPF0271 protein
MTLAFVPLGDGALRIDLPPDSDRAAVLEHLRAIPSLHDVVVAERHAAVTFDPRMPPTTDALERALASRTKSASTRTHRVVVRYDGPDLANVADALGLSASEVAALHTERKYTVRMVGFLPGFAYLGELDARLVVPRLATPRTRVPAGAVAIAGARTGIYPFASPGGWNLIGTAIDFRAFDPQQGSALRLGDRVEFVPERR